MTSRFLMRRDQTVILLIDVQEKLAAAMEARETVVANVRKVAAAAARLEVPLLVTEQYPKGLGRTVPEVAEALGPAYAPLEKVHFACTAAPGFMERLRRLGRSQVLLCGMEAHVCVLQTGLHLLDLGLGVFVAADAVCSRRREDYQAALNLLQHAGAVVTTTEAVIFQLLERAGTPEFKDLLEILR